MAGVRYALLVLRTDLLKDRKGDSVTTSNQSPLLSATLDPQLPWSSSSITGVSSVLDLMERLWLSDHDFSGGPIGDRSNAWTCHQTS